ncbi:helix-turn-helix transcriptional regulator [Fulvivirgaceae bacterium PWU4]|uniref:Helix-turn-helix transcriptional regulator n=1 Tax=Chryseosolibacter histidini TaxID=2782349 RepID=A0AAP2DIU5_9BACT|nr:helix-turn-helix transcriptional regulator [Chryseosolibacter histidini]MBT1697156.1 helix-turn-helix transcriptional regulator [Chryseosolibacter histidini]
MAINKETDSLILFGQRLRAIREAANLSQEQIHYVTGISQSHIARIEAGVLNTGINHVSRLAELFGLEDYELFQYKSPIPDSELLKKNIAKFLKSRDIDPAVFLKKSLVHLIETKLLPSKFFSSPRLAKEIAEYFKEKVNAEFTTSHISQAMEGFVKKGLVEKLETEKKSKFQYRKAQLT